MPRYLYAGGTQDAGHSNKTLYKANATNGGVSWNAATAGVIRGITADSSGNIYTAGTGLYKFSNDGSQQWGTNTSNFFYGIAIDDYGYLKATSVASLSTPYAVYGVNISNGSATGYLWPLYNSGGTYIFTLDTQLEGSDHAYYFGGTYSGSANVAKYLDSSDVWENDLHSGGTVRGLCIDSSGNIILVGDVAGSATTRKYNSGLSQQWYANHGATVWSLFVDSAGNVYTGGSVSSGYTTRKYDSSGNLLWSVNHGDDVHSITVDADGNVYTGGVLTGGYSVRKYDSAGNLQWSADLGANVWALWVVDEIVSVALAGTPTATSSATGTPHIQKPLREPPSALASDMIALGPELFLPMDDFSFVVDTPQTLTGNELIDWSGHDHFTQLDSRFGFAYDSGLGNSPSQYPIPRSAYQGMPTALWSGYSYPQIITDIGINSWNIASAWTVELWYRRWHATDGHLWYFGNTDLYSPVMHQMYLSPHYFDLYGIRHKRILYPENHSSVSGHFIAIVYDGSSTVSLYLDGVLTATLSVNISALSIQIHPLARLTLGRSMNAIPGYVSSPTEDTFAGFALYYQALTAMQVLRHYQLGTSMKTLPLHGIHPQRYIPQRMIRS